MSFSSLRIVECHYRSSELPAMSSTIPVRSSPVRPASRYSLTNHPDIESFQGQDSAPMSSAANPVAQRQIPVVTCFVPHLSRGLQFRVSLHSWYEPPVSRGTQATTSPNDSILFEARVFLDGMYAGYDCKEIATSTRRFKAETLALVGY